MNRIKKDINNSIHQKLIIQHGNQWKFKDDSYQKEVSDVIEHKYNK